jgi:hypothetical protein
VHAVVAEEFAHRSRCRARGTAAAPVPKRWRRRRWSIPSRRFFELADDLRDGRALLADGDVDAVELLAFVGAGVDGLLVDEGVDGDGGLAGLAVADDQLALAAADGNSASIALRPVCTGSCTDLRGMMPGALTSTRGAGGLDRALAVDRVAQRVDDAAQQALADGHVHDRAGALDGVAFLDLGVRAEDHDADVVGFEVERHALHAVGEFDHFAGLDLVQAVDAGDAVTDRQHGPTSETWASVPKLAIWSLMTFEISAARISMFSLS